MNMRNKDNVHTKPSRSPQEGSIAFVIKDSVVKTPDDASAMGTNLLWLALVQFFLPVEAKAVTQGWLERNLG